MQSSDKFRRENADSHPLVTPRACIQFAAASHIEHEGLWNTGAYAGDDDATLSDS
jgi:hypothetical protein